MNVNETMQRTLDDMKSRLVGVYTDPAELLEALGGSYEEVEVVHWSGGFVERLLRGANGTEAMVWSTSAYVYEGTGS